MESPAPPLSPPPLRWELSLRREAASALWRAVAVGPDGPQQFDSIAALIGWLRQLEAARPEGIR